MSGGTEGSDVEAKEHSVWEWGALQLSLPETWSARARARVCVCVCERERESVRVNEDWAWGARLLGVEIGDMIVIRLLVCLCIETGLACSAGQCRLRPSHPNPSVRPSHPNLNPNPNLAPTLTQCRLRPSHPYPNPNPNPAPTLTHCRPRPSHLSNFLLLHGGVVARSQYTSAQHRPQQHCVVGRMK